MLDVEGLEQPKTNAADDKGTPEFNCEYRPTSDARRNLIPMKTALERGHFKRTKAYRLIAEGKIIAYKDGHTTLVDADSIAAIISTAGST